MDKLRLAIALSLIATCPAWGDPLAPAFSSNVFVLGDADLVACNVQGGLALAGAGTFRAGNFAEIDAAGDLTLIAVNAPGGARYGGQLSRAGGILGPLTRLDFPKIDFASEGKALVALTAYYGLLSTSTSVVSSGPGTLTLIGTDPVLNVFRIIPPDLSTNLKIDAPSGSMVVVNVEGTSPSISLASLNWPNGTGVEFDPSHVLFNFNQATSLQIASSSIGGTILAPLASVSLVGVGEAGSIVAGGLAAWASDFCSVSLANPSPAPVPEPSSLALIAIALGVAHGILLARRAIPGRCQPHGGAEPLRWRGRSASSSAGIDGEFSQLSRTSGSPRHRRSGAP